MTIDRIDHPWAESGSLDTTLTDAKRDVGWISGDSPDQPTIERLNLLQNEVDNRLNDIIEKGPGAATGSDPFTTGVFQRSVPPDGSNAISPAFNYIDPTGTSGGSINDLVYTKKGDKNIILSVRGDTRLVLYDIDNMVWLEDVSETDLGNIGTAIYSACSDGTYAYVLWDDSGSDFYIQAYHMDTWTVKTGWPIGGAELSAYGVPFSTNQARVRIASSGKLFVSQPWVSLSSGTSDAVSIIDTSDGTVDGAGAGDSGSMSSGQIYSACSNGIHIFMALDNGTDLILSSMPISTPGATGCGWTWAPSSYSTGIAASSFGGLACNGDLIVMSYMDGTNIYTTYTASQGRTAHFQTGDADVVEALGAVCTDGLNFWAIGTRERVGSTNNILMLYRLDGALSAGYYDISSALYETYTDGEDHVRGFKAVINLRDDIPDLTDAPISSDGDSVWFCAENGSSGVGTYMYRLRRASVRS